MKSKRRNISGDGSGVYTISTTQFAINQKMRTNAVLKGSLIHPNKNRFLNPPPWLSRRQLFTTSRDSFTATQVRLDWLNRTHRAHNQLAPPRSVSRSSRACHRPLLPTAGTCGLGPVDVRCNAALRRGQQRQICEYGARSSSFVARGSTN
jgi:hypothetical protein